MCLQRFEEMRCKDPSLTLHPEIFTDLGISGKSIDRPSLKRVLRLVKNGMIHTVIMYSHDRLSRKVSHFEELIDFFERQKVAVIFLKQNFDTSSAFGKAAMRFAIEFSQLEREVIAERTRDAMQRLAEKGKWSGGEYPFGLKRDNSRDTSEKKSRGYLIWDDDEKKVAAHILEKFQELGTVTSLLQYLHSNGIAFRDGRQWAYETLKRFLCSPHLVGKVERNARNKGKQADNPEHEYRLFKASWEALIDEETWLAIRDKVGCNKCGNPKRKIHAEYLLTGLLRCKCGHLYTGNATSPREDYVYVRYSASQKCSSEDCQIRHIPAGKLDELIVRQVLRVIRDSSIVEKLVDEANGYINKQLPSLERALKFQEQQKASLESDKNALIKKLIREDDETIARMLKSELKNIDSEIEGLSGERRIFSVRG